MSYLAYGLLLYWHVMLSEGSSGSAAVLARVRQQRMNLSGNNNQPTMDALVGDQESTVHDSAANPCRSVGGTGTISTFQVPHSKGERDALQTESDSGVRLSSCTE